MKASCATSYASSLLRRTLYAKRYTRCRYSSTSGSNAATSPARTLSTSAAPSVSTRPLVRPPRRAGRQPVRREAGGRDAPAARTAAARAGVLGTELVDVVQRRAAVHGRLPGAEEVEVRTVQHEGGAQGHLGPMISVRDPRREKPVGDGEEQQPAENRPSKRGPPFAIDLRNEIGGGDVD